MTSGDALVRRCTILAVTTALTMLAWLVALAGPARAAREIRVLSNSNASENSVVATVEVHAAPRAVCSARVTKGRRHRELPRLRVSKAGAGQWSWRPSKGVPPGTYHVVVTCRARGRTARARTSFAAARGTGPGHAPTLFVLSDVVKGYPEDLGGGSGGGNEHVLYPKGQCTWWAKKKRPDLPYFPGKQGNAMKWADSAKREGYSVGDEPAVGAIAVWRSEQYDVGKYGHVAYVEAVLPGDLIRVSDMNYGGDRKVRVHDVPWKGLQFIYRPGEKAPRQPPPPPDLVPTVQLTSPVDGEAVAGTLRVTATANTGAVRFDVFYYADPWTTASATTLHQVDTTSADGFAADIDTLGIPNQGGPGGTSVVVTATAMRDDGSPSAATSAVRVNVANSRTRDGVTYYPYYVVSACEAAPECLRLRTGPGVDGYAIVGTRRDGEELEVVCQAHGQPVENPDSSASDVWDRLRDGSWAFDYYVDTPIRGAFSPPIPQCPEPTRTAVTHYDCPATADAVSKPVGPGQYWHDYFTTAGDQITGGQMAIRAPDDGTQHRAIVGFYRDAEATDAVATKTVTVPTTEAGVSFTFSPPAGVPLGTKLYFTVRAIDALTAYDQPGADGCVIGHLEGTRLTYP